MDFDFLVGKTVLSAKQVGCKNKLWGSEDSCDGKNTLELYFTDGTSCEIVGGYGGYTGESCDEYFEVIVIQDIKRD